MRYPDHLRITREGTRGGTTVPLTGVYTRTPGGDVLLYDGPADIQPGSRSYRRGPAGEPVGDPPDVAFLPWHRAAVLADVAIDDKVEATFGYLGVERSGAVEMVRPLDETLLVRWAV